MPGGQETFENQDLKGTNRVEFAVSLLFSLPGLASAYHTSVLVNGEEFFFSDSGIFSNRALTSHNAEPSELVYVGLSSRTGAHLLDALNSHFRSGSYDLIRKNCNSFSDCALYFLLEKRLPSRYSAMEGLGQRASFDLLQRFTKGAYVPNQVSESFSADEVIRALADWSPTAVSPTSSSSFPSVRSKPALYIGARITVMGLKSADHLNGQGAKVLRFNAVNGRWEARINFSGEIKAFRAENLRPAGELVLEEGGMCRIHGLQSEAGQALNGREGEVLQYLHDVSRYEVVVDGTQRALKAENLQALP